jgi:hypothetical protein
VVAVGHFHYDRIAGCKIETIGIFEKFLSAILETNLDDIKFIYDRHVHIGQPIEYVHFITATGAAGAIILAP